MSKELRANLIFFCILLVLVLPGFFILMRKKLSGTSDPNYLPVPAPHSAAFNQPLPVPPMVPRIEPNEVRAWTEDLLKQHVHAEALLYHRASQNGPAMGNAFQTQCLYLHAEAGKVRVVVLIWEQSPATESMIPTMAAHIDDVAVPAFGVVHEPVAVPKNVRHALQKAGYTDPPEVIWIVDGTFATAAAPSTLVTKYSDRRGKSVTETVTLK